MVNIFLFSFPHDNFKIHFPILMLDFIIMHQIISDYLKSVSLSFQIHISGIWHVDQAGLGNRLLLSCCLSLQPSWYPLESSKFFQRYTVYSSHENYRDKFCIKIRSSLLLYTEFHLLYSEIIGRQMGITFPQNRWLRDRSNKKILISLAILCLKAKSYLQ